MNKHSGLLGFITRQLNKGRFLFTYFSLARKWPFWIKLKGLFSKDFEDEFFFLTFSILGKLAFTKGTLGTWQHAVFEEFMGSELNLSSKQKAMAFSILRESKNIEESFEELVKSYYQNYKSSALMLEHLLGILLDIALSDDRYTETELRYIYYAKNVFEVSEEEFNHIKERQILLKKLKLQLSEQTAQNNNKESSHFQSSPVFQKTDSYTVLGVKPDDSTELIKKSYRKLVMQYHPDRLRNAGLSKEFISRATNNFHEIQKAYDTICKERGI